MSNLSNVALWFAKDESSNIVTINKVNEEYKGKYNCPLCNGEVIPKALKSDYVSPHFAHVNRENCSGESIIHWWLKNEIVKKGDVIEIITDTNKMVKCKELVLEKSYETPYGVYKPDITMITDKNETVFIEINHKNKKNVKNYYLKWKHLKSIVLEFNTDRYYKEYDNKTEDYILFNTIYYENIGISLDEDNKRYKKFKDSLNEIDCKTMDDLMWFIDDIYRYNIGLIDSAQIEMDLNYICEFMSRDHRNKVCEFYRKSSCNKAILNAIKYRKELIKSSLGSCDVLDSFNVYDPLYNNYIYDKIFSPLNISLRIPKYIKDFFKELRVDCSECINLSLETYEVGDKLNSILKNIDRTIKNLKSEHFEIMMFKSECNKAFNHGLLNTKVYYSIGQYLELEIKANYRERYFVKVCLISNKIFFEDRAILEFNEKISSWDLGIFLNLLKVLIDLRKTYSYVNKSYKVSIDNTSFIIKERKSQKIISEFNYDENTKYDNVINKFSYDIRQYLYGGNHDEQC